MGCVIDVVLRRIDVEVVVAEKKLAAGEFDFTSLSALTAGR